MFKFYSSYSRFVKNDTIFEFIVENTELCQFVEDIYFAGVMTQYSYDEVTAFQGFTSTPFMPSFVKNIYLFILENPFVLTELNGNPHIVYYRGPLDYLDGESFNVMLAKSDVSKSNDILFIGGDFNNQGFSAWKRND